MGVLSFVGSGPGPGGSVAGVLHVRTCVLRGGSGPGGGDQPRLDAAGVGGDLEGGWFDGVDAPSVGERGHDLGPGQLVYSSMAPVAGFPVAEAEVEIAAAGWEHRAEAVGVGGTFVV